LPRHSALANLFIVRRHRYNPSKGIHILELLNGEQWQRWVPIPIRVILGVGFMVHGWAKWSRGPAAFAELLKHAHVPLPLANAWVVTLLEIFGGLALLAGAFVTIVSVPLILSMLGAMFTVNINYGFSAVNTIGLTPDGPCLARLVTKSTCYTSPAWWR
jgi:putative oxidoreductase